MLNTLNINLKTDIKTDRPTTLPIKLMSQDKNNNQFILRFTNGGEPVNLDDTYTVEILTKFQKSGASRLTSAIVRQDYATWEFDTDYITQDERVDNFVYVRKAGSLVVSADANAFAFDVGLSEIDKDAGRVAEIYDENYQKYLDEFKDNVDFEEIAQAEQERKDAEILRQESYDAKVDTAIVEADVVDKVDNKVAELTPQINNLTAQLAQTKKIIGFNFLEEGGIAGDATPQTAAANTTLFRALMTACDLNGGGEIAFPKGTFYFSKYNDTEIIHSYSNVNVYGVGMEQTILKCIPETSTTGGYALFRGNNMVNVNYRDFSVDMYDQSMTVYGPGGKAFYLIGVKDSTFKDLKLKGTPSTAMGIDHLVNVHIDNVTVIEGGRLWGMVPPPGTSVLFDPLVPSTANEFPGGAGIGIGTGKYADEHFKITNCTTDLCGHYGIFVEHQQIYNVNVLNESKDIVIANNICRNNRFSGMGIRGGTRVTLSNNQSYDSGCYGLYIDTKSKVHDVLVLRDSIVVGNMFNGNGLDGIRIDGRCDISGLSLRSNEIFNNGEYGISMDVFKHATLVSTIQENIVIKDNTFFRNALGEIQQWDGRVIPYINLVIEDNEYLPAIPPVTMNVYDSTDVKILYQGAGWAQVGGSNLHGSNAKRANNTVGYTYAKIVFNGTGFKWFIPTNTNKGKALVTVDYGVPVLLDLYTLETLDNHVVYEISGLATGIHTVLIDYVESKRTESTSTEILIDAIVIEGGTLLDYTGDNKIRVIDRNPNIVVSGTWAYTGNEMYGCGSARWTRTAASYAQFTFTGTDIDVFASAGPTRGIAKVILDGAETLVDQYAAVFEYGKKLFTASALHPTNVHTLRIEYTDTKNAASSATTITLDDFVITAGNIITV